MASNSLVLSTTATWPITPVHVTRYQPPDHPNHQGLRQQLQARAPVPQAATTSM